ncbi:MAG: DNA-protecting protein DprA [Bacteroidales bacterium]|nr:DNA-protecting protein DprA [Bacteroidales bacterium]
MDPTDYETICGITLNRVFGYEPAAARRLISRFGSPGAVFSQSPSTLDEAFGPWSKYRHSICREELDVSEKEFARLRSLGCTFVLFGEPGYPPLLADCEDAPAGLYIRSSVPPGQLWKPKHYVSVVGTRDISPYGKEWTEKMVGALSRTRGKPMIVSGFAIGVDITAHLAALAFGLPTVAVIPVGIDSIYPWRHRHVAERMLATPGCAIVTDFPPGTPPVPFNFLRRNRIIAGISGATILAESKAHGGGTMTARLAASYGREVYCLPGRIDDVRSAGCNRLIREKLAEPVTDLDALGTQMGLGSSRKTAACSLETRIRDTYSGTESGMLERIVGTALLIRDNRGITPDEISATLGIPPGEVAAVVCLLESDGFICTDLLRRCTIDNKKV